jgi:membrane associated rhomboid family serine protease
MLIPIGTDVRLRRAPVGNWSLLGLNVVVYLLIDQFHSTFVSELLPPLHASVPTLYEYISYQFRHASFGHLAGNMLFLWLFGNPVCDRMGSLSYVIFYLAGGVVAGSVFAATNTNPLMGASGAIAAVTAAFLVLFPRVHITILLWLLILTTIQLPSMFFIVFKIILWDNVIAPSLDRGAMASGVAFSAHLGGYAFGFAVALAMLLLRGLPRHQFDLLALWNRWRRRSGITGEMSFAGTQPARPIVVEEVRSRPLEPVSLTAAEQLREDILDRISEHDLDEAARLYQQLLELDTGHVLPRSAQLEIGNHLAQSERYEAAVKAYEGFLEAYPTAGDAAQVRLYAGLICRRYLRDSHRAVDYLRAALDGLSLESQRHLAAQEIAAAEADISGPDPSPDRG